MKSTEVSPFENYRLKDWLDLAKRRRRWIVLTGIAVFLIASVLALRLPNVFRAQTVILIDPQQVPRSYVNDRDSTSVEDRLAILRQQVLSATNLQKVIDQMGLYPKLREKMGQQDVLKEMAKSIEVETVEGGRRLSAFRIVYYGDNAVVAAQVANQLASMFIEDNLKAREQQSYGTAEFLQSELEKTAKDVQQKDKELQDLKSKYVLDLPESQQYHLEQLNGLRSQLQAAEDRINGARQQIVMLQSMGATAAPTVDLDAQGGAGESSYDNEIQKLQTRLSELRVRYGPKYPEVLKAEDQLKALQKKAAAEEKESRVVAQPAKKNTLAGGNINPVLAGQIQELNQTIRDQTNMEKKIQEQIAFHVSKLQQIPLFEQKISGVMRDYDTLHAYYKELLDKKLTADTVAAMETRQKGERFVILDPAQIPEKPYGPHRLLILLAGLAGGLIGGIGLALLTEVGDASVRNEHELVKILEKPVLGAVPAVQTKAELRWHRIRAGALVAVTVVSSIFVGFVLTYVATRLL